MLTDTDRTDDERSKPKKTRREKRAEVRKKEGDKKCTVFSCQHKASDHQLLAERGRKFCHVCVDVCTPKKP